MRQGRQIQHVMAKVSGERKINLVLIHMPLGIQVKANTSHISPHNNIYSVI